VIDKEEMKKIVEEANNMHIEDKEQASQLRRTKSVNNKSIMNKLRNT
jgi:hypothetical protein